MSEHRPGAATRRPPQAEQDGAREERQRPDHGDREHGPAQEQGGEAPLPEARLESPPIEHGRQPSRPGRPGRWQEEPGDRDEPGRVREPERRPTGQHEKS